MSQRATKKLRQYYRRDIRQKIFAESITFARMLKPRPRWCPKRLWRFGLGLFIRIPEAAHEKKENGNQGNQN